MNTATAATSREAPANRTIYIVDDDEAVRDALAMIAAGRRPQRRDVSRSAEAFVETRADATSGCLVLDVRMPGMSGIELQDWLAQHGCALPVLFLHGAWERADGRARREARRLRFPRKPIDDQRLLEAVDGAMAAGTFAGSPAAGGGFAYPARARSARSHPLGPPDARDREALFISIKTVEFHRTRIHAKLKVSSMAELFTLCMGRARTLPVAG